MADQEQANLMETLQNRLPELLFRSRPLLPVLFILAAIGLGIFRGPGASILALAGGAVLAFILFVWSSLRTFFGDADLPLDVSLQWGVAMAEDEQKHAILRAIKDLEFEYSLGRISDDDYQELSQRYRSDAKRILRTLDSNLRPSREKAEALFEEHLANLAQTSKPKKGSKKKKKASKSETKASKTIACSACDTENDPDSKFCKQCGELMASKPTATEPTARNSSEESTS
jgi:hypothetical protein